MFISDFANFSLELFRGNGFQVKVRNFSIPTPTQNDESAGGFVILRNVFETYNAKEYCASRIAYSSDFLTGDLQTQIVDLTLFAMDKEGSTATLLDQNTEPEKFAIVSLQIKAKDYSEDTKCLTWSETEWTDEFCNVLSVAQSSVECQCSALGYIK